VIALLLASDHQDAKTVWAIFGPAVGWSFIGVGLYAWRRRPESRTALMVLLGFAWFLSALDFANSRLLYSVAFVVGGLWGGVFLQLVVSFPSGRLAPGWDRTLVIAGYLIFTVASIPAMLFAGPHELGCDDCPTNVLLIRRDPDLASARVYVDSATASPRSTGRSRSRPPRVTAHACMSRSHASRSPAPEARRRWRHPPRRRTGQHRVDEFV
jgi:hypothetical protein